MSERDWIFEALKDKGLTATVRMVTTYITGKLRGVEDLTKCALCPNICKFVCPVHVVLGSETYSPSGRARVAYYIKHKVLEPTEENIKPIYTCLNCYACNLLCPFEFTVPDVTHSVKTQLRKKGALPKVLKSIEENLKSHRFLYGSRPAELTRKGRVLYLRGCTVRQHLRDLARITIEVFSKLGIDLATLPKESCCGVHAYYIGANDLFKEIARENTEVLEGSDWKYAITSCPIVAYTYRSLYPRFGIKTPLNVYYVSEVLKDLLKSRELNEIRKTVVLHDSWALTRGLKSNSVIELLKLIPGLDIKLPMRHGKEVFDVGYYCTLLAFIDSKLAKKIAAERLRELREEASVIVVSSPDAKLLFTELGAEVHDIIELVAEALGIQSR